MPNTRASRVNDLVTERLEHVRKSVRERAEAQGAPLGQTSVSDEVFRKWFELQIQKSPPTVITLADGMRVMASPWATALPFVDGGKPIISRYLKIIESEGA